MERYDGVSTLPDGTIIFAGRFNQYRMEVQEDLGDSVRVINLARNYGKEPYVLEKTQIKGLKHRRTRP